MEEIGFISSSYHCTWMTYLLAPSAMVIPPDDDTSFRLIAK